MTPFFQPPTSARLKVGHLQQANPGECLATCTAMVLTYYNVPYDYQQLIKTLRIEPDLGTPFPNITRLAELELLVGYQENGTLEILHRLLTQGWPCLIAVDTGELPYWQTSTGHAVVLIGMSQHHVYLNDPEMPEGPLQVPIGDFYLAWQEHLFRYAVLAVR